MTESLKHLFKQKPSSSYMTKELKIIGGGDMQSGIKTVLKIGRKQGAVAAIVGSAILGTPIAVMLITENRKKKHLKKALEERQIIIDSYEKKLKNQVDSKEKEESLIMDTISQEQYESIIDDELLENEPDQYELLHELELGIDSMDSDEYDEKRKMLTNLDAIRVLETHEKDFFYSATGLDCM